MAHPRFICLCKDVMAKKPFLEDGIGPTIRISFKGRVIPKLSIPIPLCFSILHVEDFPIRNASLHDLCAARPSELFIYDEAISNLALVLNVLE